MFKSFGPPFGFKSRRLFWTQIIGAPLGSNLWHRVWVQNFGTRFGFKSLAPPFGNESLAPPLGLHLWHPVWIQIFGAHPGFKYLALPFWLQSLTPHQVQIVRAPFWVQIAAPLLDSSRWRPHWVQSFGTSFGFKSLEPTLG